MTEEELKAYIEKHMPKELRGVTFEAEPQFYTRLTKSSFVYFKGKHAGEWKDQAMERKARQHILQHMGGFELT
uniref:hypothetical protein n=1 Tax=Helicobacter suis TaxID=104628 RepID=UPI0013D56B3D